VPTIDTIVNMLQGHVTVLEKEKLYVDSKQVRNVSTWVQAHMHTRTYAQMDAQPQNIMILAPSTGRVEA